MAGLVRSREHLARGRDGLGWWGSLRKAQQQGMALRSRLCLYAWLHRRRLHVFLALQASRWRAPSAASARSARSSGGACACIAVFATPLARLLVFAGGGGGLGGGRKWHYRHARFPISRTHAHCVSFPLVYSLSGMASMCHAGRRGRRPTGSGRSVRVARAPGASGRTGTRSGAATGQPGHGMIDLCAHNHDRPMHALI